MDLKGATIQKTANDTFQIVTSSQKIGIFSCPAKQLGGWIDAIQNAINNISLALNPFDDYYDDDAQDFFNPSFDRDPSPTPSVFPLSRPDRSNAFQIDPSAPVPDSEPLSDLDKKALDAVWMARNGPTPIVFTDTMIENKICRSSFSGESLFAWLQANSFASSPDQVSFFFLSFLSLIDD